MNNTVEICWKKVGGTVLGILTALWLIPPIVHKTMHYCPVKPDGIQEAEAITAWARKYGVSCNVCHAAGYKLTRAGQKFLRGGHVMPGTDKEANLSDYVALTAKIRAWTKNTKAETLATGVETQTPKSSFEGHALSLYTGGPLDNGFSYFSEMYFHENEKKNIAENSEKSESDMGDWGRSKLAETYLQYVRGIGGSEDTFWTVRIGRIMPWLIHLHGGGARLEYNRPKTFAETLGGTPYRPFSRQYGVGAGLGVKDAFLEAGIVNGTGKLENSVEIGTDTHKDLYAALDYSLGDKGSMVGVYYYNGKYPTNWFGTKGTDVGANTIISREEFSQLGFLGNYTFEVEGVGGALLGAYFTGKNKYDTTAALGYEQKSTGYYLEAQGHFQKGDLSPYFRWDFNDPDTAFDDNEKSGPALGLHWKPMEHGRFVLEWDRDSAKNGKNGTAATTQTTNDTYTLEIQFMF
ncbi:MAG: hypothetical protein HY399_03345 [Elusimicrobia bacterium]|nr:hypothetical protein [Elusimicrobiota bacterium]